MHFFIVCIRMNNKIVKKQIKGFTQCYLLVGNAILKGYCTGM